MSSTAMKRRELTARTPRLVGRKEELRRLSAYLEARGENQFIYYWAHGGLGKTRLLEELMLMVEEAGPKVYNSGIIDLYHTDTHGTSDIERVIVEGLDPNKKYFNRYRAERVQFEMLRERGADPGVMESRRQVLSQLFVQDCREMAHDAQKLVICFDTVELLQYESSVIEEKAGLENVDARIKPWLLTNLSKLANVLVVFAGRPKEPLPDEKIDHQTRLVTDMQQAFGKELAVVELTALPLKDAQDFIAALSEDVEIIPASDLPVVHRLTGGRPIYLHLMVDLLQSLALEPAAILDLFREYTALADADVVPDDDPQLVKARNQIEVHILKALIFGTDELGEYLRRIALMPKGIDSEILQEGLGWPVDKVEELLKTLEPLSFTKRFKPLPGAEQLHGERLFLHDELYTLLTRADVVPHLRVSEREVAHMLITNYYNPRIEKLEAEMTSLSPAERIALRERLYKLLVERLYYMLAHDPRKGYAEYKRLSDQASRHRWVGFSMRLLDEFLRFYNTPDRRKQFESVRIPYEQVVRESAQMWVERFHWWGLYEKGENFSAYILDKPEDFFIRPDKDIAILANICALWDRAHTLLQGFDQKVLIRAQKMLDKLPALAKCTPEQTLARARLATSIGYQYRLEGALTRAAANYVDAKAAYQKLDAYPDELAMLLTNLAYAYAQQGRMILARPLAHEALRINEEQANEYSTGLSLTTLAEIALMRGNHPRAVEYGEEALGLFRDLEDPHGTVLAYRIIARAKRRMAKHEMEKGRKLETAQRQIEEARAMVDTAIKIATDAGLKDDEKNLKAESGRLYRDFGQIISQVEDQEKGLAVYRQSERELKEALQLGGWPAVEEADTLQDLADVMFLSGDAGSAQDYLHKIETLLGAEYIIKPGEHLPKKEIPHEPFAPMGKASMLRGQMAFAENKTVEGLRYFILSYAYFMHFSPTATQMDTMIEYLYSHLRALPLEQQQTLIDSTRRWVEQSGLGVDVRPFIQLLGDLLGV